MCLCDVGRTNAPPPFGLCMSAERFALFFSLCVVKVTEHESRRFILQTFLRFRASLSVWCTSLPSPPHHNPQIMIQPSPYIVVPPRHYLIIDNPVDRDEAGAVLTDDQGYVLPTSPLPFFSAPLGD